MKKAIVAGLLCLLMLLCYFIGYECAVKNAILTAYTEYGYEITYHGQTYWYEYEIH